MISAIEKNNTGKGNRGHTPNPTVAILNRWVREGLDEMTFEQRLEGGKSGQVAGERCSRQRARTKALG